MDCASDTQLQVGENSNWNNLAAKRFKWEEILFIKLLGFLGFTLCVPGLFSDDPTQVSRILIFLLQFLASLNLCTVDLYLTNRCRAELTVGMFRS